LVKLFAFKKKSPPFKKKTTMASEDADTFNGIPGRPNVVTAFNDEEFLRIRTNGVVIFWARLKFKFDPAQLPQRAQLLEHVSLVVDGHTMQSIDYAHKFWDCDSTVLNVDLPIIPQRGLRTKPGSDARLYVKLGQKIPGFLGAQLWLFSRYRHAL
jgi:hypothetical protein